ncbi:MAG TPA: hypothetical protein VGI49_15320 [Mycobacterium sp.]
MTRLSTRSRFNATLPCPYCGLVHDYYCRLCVAISIVAALGILASLLVLMAAVPAVIR